MVRLILVLLAAPLLLSGCFLMLPVKLTAPEAIEIARRSLPPAYAEWNDLEVTLRPRSWVVTFRNVKASPDALGIQDAAYPHGRADRYRDLTIYVNADSGTITRRELTP